MLALPKEISIYVIKNWSSTYIFSKILLDIKFGWVEKSMNTVP